VPPGEQSGDALLRRARELHGAREYAALVEALASVEPDALLETPELGYLLADGLQRVGERERALPLVQALERPCARRGNDSLFRRRLNLEGVLLFGLGRTGDAEEAWTRLLGASADAGDTNFVARSNQNLGVIHTMRGDREAALASHARAIAAYRSLGYLRGLAQVHENQAITYREIDFWREADHHFLAAIEYAAADGSRDEVARARQERALLLCYQRDGRLAEKTARLALHEWERLGDPVGQGDTRRILGLIALSAGRAAEAGEHAERAQGLARSARAPLLEAESLELRAVLARLDGDEEGASSLRSDADARFASIGASSWGASVRARAEWLATRG
jgi:tetratricopeptide (TPR) repeat protein